MSHTRVVPLHPVGVVLEAQHEIPLSAVDPALARWLLERHKLVVLRGFTACEPSAFVAWCKEWPAAKTVDWEFGSMLELRESPDARNYLFTAEAVPFHWDGAFHVEPDVLCFHCVEAPESEQGGETLFVDGTALWRDASPEERARWDAIELEYATDKLAHYGGRFRTPLVVSHPRSKQPVLRFAEPVASAKNPVSLTVHGSTDAPDVLTADLARRLYDRKHTYAHRWRPGDYLFADNHALLHGRRAFTSGAPRLLRRVQLQLSRETS